MSGDSTGNDASKVIFQVDCEDILERSPLLINYLINYLIKEEDREEKVITSYYVKRRIRDLFNRACGTVNRKPSEIIEKLMLIFIKIVSKNFSRDFSKISIKLVRAEEKSVSGAARIVGEADDGLCIVSANLVNGFWIIRCPNCNQIITYTRLPDVRDIEFCPKCKALFHVGGKMNER